MIWNTHSKNTVVVDDESESVVEPYSDAVSTIETEHAQIHAGNGYQVTGTYSSLGSGNSIYFYIDPTTPIHWRDYKVAADGAPVEVEFFENPTVSANGSSVPIYNRNRLSSNTSTATIYSGPTVTDDGTLLYVTRIVGVGSGANATGETEGIPLEWVTDSGNTYLLKITNNDSGNIDLVYRFFWYEL